MGIPLVVNEPDLVHPVADDALFGRAAPEGRVASEAVGGELQMGVHQLSGTDHQVRGDDGEHQQGRQIDQDDGDDGLSVHFHCQKRKMLRMWATPRTPNTRVIGKCTARHCFIRSTATASQKISFSTASPVRPRSA